jgi:hypothetical protein
MDGDETTLFLSIYISDPEARIGSWTINLGYGVNGRRIRGINEEISNRTSVLDGDNKKYCSN